MFPNNNENPYFPYYHSKETIFNKSFPYDHQNPSSSKHHDNINQESPLFLPQFPSPFLNGHATPLMSHVFPHPPLPGTVDAAGDQAAGKGKTKKGGGASRKRNLTGATTTTPRKRTAGKKDRHSKISTAKGVRDRRMRLSLQIARKFFDLQDMLGFDKASKTIDWLFSKSKNAIKELIMTTKNNVTSISSGDEYEVASIMEENYSNNNNNEATTTQQDVSNKKLKTAAIRQLTANSHHPPERQTDFNLESSSSTKESREKARDWDRERAKENNKTKMMMSKGLENSSHNYLYESNPSSWSLEQLGSSSNNSPFLEESSCHQEINKSNYCSNNPHEANYCYNNPQLEIENQFGASLMEYHQDNGESFMGFLGNWELGAASTGSIDELAPFAGINNPSTHYFGATSFQFQSLDQEKQFSYNHNSLG